LKTFVFSTLPPESQNEKKRTGFVTTSTEGRFFVIVVMILGRMVLFAITVVIMIVVMILRSVVLNTVAVVIMIIMTLEQVDVTRGCEERERDESDEHQCLHFISPPDHSLVNVRYEERDEHDDRDPKEECDHVFDRVAQPAVPVELRYERC
jgi:hypothetical protein